MLPGWLGGSYVRTCNPMEDTRQKNTGRQRDIAWMAWWELCQDLCSEGEYAEVHWKTNSSLMDGFVMCKGVTTGRQSKHSTGIYIGGVALFKKLILQRQLQGDPRGDPQGDPGHPYKIQGLTSDIHKLSTALTTCTNGTRMISHTDNCTS